MNLGKDIKQPEFKFIPYNTCNTPLPLPEYGRNIQQMVDHCVMIEDREERTACAYAIIEIMKTLFPKNITDKKDLVKLWDHLNVMARFELEIDFPFEVAGPEQKEIKPSAIPYDKSKIELRIYGRHICQMIETVSEMDPSEERDYLIDYIVNQMKKILFENNPEAADNYRVIQDLARLSKGKITLDQTCYYIPEYNEMDNPHKKGKKKNKLNLNL